MRDAARSHIEIWEDLHIEADEYVELDSVEPRLYLLTRLIMETSRN